MSPGMIPKSGELVAPPTAEPMKKAIMSFTINLLTAIHEK
jgi:hypothetical protein